MRHPSSVRPLRSWLGLLWSLALWWGQPVLAGERLMLADAPTLLTGLVSLAQSQGYFAAQELDVVIQRHPTGDEALLAVEQGQAEVATVAETALTLHLFRVPELRVLAEIGGWDNEVRILARRDAGIEAPADLRGKRIGTQQRLSTHYFLDAFLARHGLAPTEVTPVFMKAPELPLALVAGQVDAISLRDPFLNQAQERLGTNAILFEAPGLYPKVFVLAAKRETVERRGAAIDRLLKALLQAEILVRERPVEARALLQKSLPGDNLAKVWPQVRLRLWLDHRFILTLESIADWAQRIQLVEAGEVPNFMANLYPEPLRRLRPIAVNLLE